VDIVNFLLMSLLGCSMDRSTELHLDYRTVSRLGCSMDCLTEFHLDHSMELCMGSLMELREIPESAKSMI